MIRSRGFTLLDLKKGCSRTFFFIVFFNLICFLAISGGLADNFVS